MTEQRIIVIIIIVSTQITLTSPKLPFQRGCFSAVNSRFANLLLQL
nr:MAG TPA: hypothetical protein [Caudoviricetes sp.]